jgi:organic hydroperoxide reductase OsmC/OhrA
MKRFGSATWNGGLREGKGSVSTESGALETYPYTFFSRYHEKPGTNPEELLGAAHAACFTMSVVRQTTRHGGLRAGASRQQIGSRHRQGRRWLFHHLGPSYRHREDTGRRPEHVSVDRSKGKGRLPCFQVDQGGDRLRGHAQSVTGEIHHLSRSCQVPN